MRQQRIAFIKANLESIWNDLINHPVLLQGKAFLDGFRHYMIVSGVIVTSHLLVFT